MVKFNFCRLIFAIFFLFVVLPASYASTRVYLNDTTQYIISPSSDGVVSKTLNFGANLTVNENINHTFLGNGSWWLEYTSSGTGTFLMGIVVSQSTNSLYKEDCALPGLGDIILLCDSGCGSNFSQFHNFTVHFNSTSITAKIFVDGINKSDVSLCSGASQTDSLLFQKVQTLSGNITNNLVLANNLKPNFTGPLPNLTWPEDTSFILNISGNFSDPNNDSFAYGINSTVNNITIAINSAGIVNLTPSANFFGIRNVTFYANDSENITFSNLIILNVTNINDPPFFNPALGVVTAERNRIFVYDVNFTDFDNDNVTFITNSSFFNITAEGIIKFTPSSAGNITVNVTMNDNTVNVSGILTIESKDTLSPVITAISTSNSGSTTVTVTLSATTDETAICAFAASDINFSAMAQMSSTNSTSHSNSQSFTSDNSGTYYVRCNDTFGNAMNFSNSTSFSVSVQKSSSSSSGSDGGGGGGAAGNSRFECSFEWRCSEWSECSNGRQERKCGLFEVPVYTLNDTCPQSKIPEQGRECQSPIKVQNDTRNETCDDNIKNQDEAGVDCGGKCRPCAIETKNNETESLPLAGAAVAPQPGIHLNIWMLIALIILAAILVLAYLQFAHRKIFRKKELDKKDKDNLEEFLKKIEQK